MSTKRKSSYVRKTSSPEELAAARMVGLAKARAKIDRELNTAIKRSVRFRDSEANQWAREVKSQGWPYYRDHRMPPHGWLERGRGATWKEGRTKPKAFIEHYQPDMHQVFLVPKTRGPAKFTGLMYSGARYPKGELTNHYKKEVFNKAIRHARVEKNAKPPSRKDGLDAQYKWAKGYLQRNKLGIPRKSRKTMGPG
jgi:hypothetical protein